VTSERWLTAVWPKVQQHLPPAPATVVELGCGRFGGFVPRLRALGYEVLGVDPSAPDGAEYRQIEFEHSELPAPLDAVIACTSLHHVADPAEVVAKIAGALAPAGLAIVVEWDRESFDEATARWSLDRVGDDGWLARRHEGWAASGQSWERYLSDWAGGHGIHPVGQILRHLDERFQRVHCQRGPYLFADLPSTSEADELRAIESGAIRALRIDYVGRLAE
jgi:SAM-dependent methyltransferase